MHQPPAISLQQHFAASDDAAELLSQDGAAPQTVDATGACLGELVELLMLKRSAPGTLTIRDRSARGHLFRKLLAGERPFSCVDGLGLYHASPGQAAIADEATDFADEARGALRAAGLVESAAWRLSGALRELLDNVDQHGGNEATCLSGFSVQPGEAWLCVADTGGGVLAGYRSSGLAVLPADAEEALKWAVLEHRSRTGMTERGTGFQTVANALRSLDASMRVRSDDASLELEQQGSAGDALLREQGQLSGFVVTMHLRWRDT